MLSLLFVSNMSFADDGDRKIRFSGNLNDNSSQRLSVKELEKHFTLIEIKAYNPWEKHTAEYTGILLDELITKIAKPNVQSISLKAIDDYQVEIKKELWESNRILLVTKQDGEYLSVAKKGPMRVIFPDYDASKKEHEMNLPLWLWMITKIEFN